MEKKNLTTKIDAKSILTEMEELNILGGFTYERQLDSNSPCRLNDECDHNFPCAENSSCDNNQSCSGNKSCQDKVLCNSLC